MRKKIALGVGLAAVVIVGLVYWGAVVVLSEAADQAEASW